MSELRKRVKIVLTGARPLMFDRYPGDNNTQLSTEEKLYLTAKKEIYLPSINIYSMLVADSGRSACKQFCGKAWRSVTQAVAAMTTIEPFEIPIKANGKQLVFKNFDDKIKEHSAVARVKKAGLSIPSPKKRPVISCPWEIEFVMEIQESKELSIKTIQNLFIQSETIGLGTFRPFFGRFVVSYFEEIK